jgi:hypothetical protein
MQPVISDHLLLALGRLINGAPDLTKHRAKYFKTLIDQNPNIKKNSWEKKMKEISLQLYIVNIECFDEQQDWLDPIKKAFREKRERDKNAVVQPSESLINRILDSKHNKKDQDKKSNEVVSSNKEESLMNYFKSKSNSVMVEDVDGSDGVNTAGKQIFFPQQDTNNQNFLQPQQDIVDVSSKTKNQNANSTSVMTASQIPSDPKKIKPPQMTAPPPKKSGANKSRQEGKDNPQNRKVSPKKQTIEVVNKLFPPPNIVAPPPSNNSMTNPYLLQNPASSSTNARFNFVDNMEQPVVTFSQNQIQSQTVGSFTPIHNPYSFEQSASKPPTASFNSTSLYFNPRPPVNTPMHRLNSGELEESDMKYSLKAFQKPAINAPTGKVSAPKNPNQTVLHGVTSPPSRSFAHLLQSPPHSPQPAVSSHNQAAQQRGPTSRTHFQDNTSSNKKIESERLDVSSFVKERHIARVVTQINKFGQTVPIKKALKSGGTGSSQIRDEKSSSQGTNKGSKTKMDVEGGSKGGKQHHSQKSDKEPGKNVGTILQSFDRMSKASKGTSDQGSVREISNPLADQIDEVTKMRGKSGRGSKIDQSPTKKDSATVNEIIPSTTTVQVRRTIHSNSIYGQTNESRPVSVTDDRTQNSSRRMDSEKAESQKSLRDSARNKSDVDKNAKKPIKGKKNNQKEYTNADISKYLKQAH